jgi:hypothetical protein
MRNLVVLVLLPAVLAQGCASAATSNPPTGAATPATSRTAATDPAKFPAINDDLAGEPATVELASGEVVQQARSVRLGTEVTSWQEPSGRERTVPTAEVRRVLREQKRLIGRGFGYGAAAAFLPAALVAGNYKSTGFLSGAGGFYEGLLIVVGGGLVGMVVAAVSRHPVVVYQGPPASRAAATGSATELHCRLAPAVATGDRLECTPGRQ